jgi:predicted Zn-dependent peptidase
MHLGKTYHKTVLDNGIRVVSEEINHVRSVSTGIWVQSGSCYEDHGTNGTAHFIEHMLFKGTDRRSAFDIASAIDSVGGVMNAFTGKELTSFYIKIPDYHLSLAIDLLADILQKSRFQEEEIVKEQSVVLQEISMVEDSPDDYIHDFFEAVFWDGHPLGLSVLGTKDQIKSLTRERLVSFFKDRYGADNLVFAAAGHLKHDVLVEMVNDAFGSMKKGTTGAIIRQPEVTSRIAVLEKDLEQVHMVIGTLAPSATNPQRYPGFLLNAVLGGSMSSRLFQEIREKRGLAYAIHSYLAPYADTGLLGIYAGVGEDQVRIVVNLIEDALKRLCDEKLTEKETHDARELIKGNFLLSMESTDNRMMRLAKNELCFGKHIPPEDVIRRIEAVESEDVRELACELFDPRILSIVATGRVSEKDIAFIRQGEV